MVKDSSVIAVQIFDQRKFKKRDQGFLGVVNVRVSDVLDLDMGGHGPSPSLRVSLHSPSYSSLFHIPSRDVNTRSQEIQ